MHKEQHHHSVTTVDYKRIDDKKCFVEVKGYDAILGSEFKGVIKFLNGEPFGDIIHPLNSSLSPDCRTFVTTYVITKYNAGEYN
jgi:hypothetical protein